MRFLPPASGWILTVLSVCSTLYAAAGKPVILQNFGDSARYTLWTRFATPSPNGAILRINTMASRDEWNPVFQTKPGMPKPSTTYVATFRCRVDNPDINAKYLCFLSRPVSPETGHSTRCSSEAAEAPLSVRSGSNSEPERPRITHFKSIHTGS